VGVDWDKLVAHFSVASYNAPVKGDMLCCWRLRAAQSFLYSYEKKITEDLHTLQG